MRFAKKLASAVANNNSLLCVGLDPDLAKLPTSIARGENPLLEFNKAIVDATADLVCAYKLNSAMYEAEGSHGIDQLKQTSVYVTSKYPNIPIIMDAKRADIGNTNNGYISYTFDYLNMDAVTLHPYLGGEALQPFLDLKEKGLIILCRTSNDGAGEFQDLIVKSEPLYQRVARQVSDKWNENNNCLLVIGATYPEEMKIIRDIVGDNMTFLVPGVGVQGGSVADVMKAGATSGGDGLIINSSRGIIFASNGDDFAEAARNEALKLVDEINQYR
ncbi:orotidine-5'-phosphate decarboxylase [Candidatus Saccharibacteria bacterium]|nr:orotidine-5'-phosphate decarboxylase [Candidatus Saccharibacteria bacterium]